jgi:hypothetical protein
MTQKFSNLNFAYDTQLFVKFQSQHIYIYIYIYIYYDYFYHLKIAKITKWQSLLNRNIFLFFLFVFQKIRGKKLGYDKTSRA